MSAISEPSVSRQSGMRNVPRLLLALHGVLVVAICAAPLGANTVLDGNTAGSPVRVAKNCPVHAGNVCSSTLVPSSVVLIATPTEWFKSTLQAEYPGADWHFNYVGGNSNMNGTFDVEYYRAYNDCPKFLGAEIKVSFVPEPGSLIMDVLWLQAYEESWPGHSASAMDDRSHLPPAKQPGTLFGPFYPYQDEDEEPPLWQANWQYDYFYDKPGDPCPSPGTVTTVRFETYACWWDDHFNADGTIVDVGSPGHNVWIHEGFGWGYELRCVPEPLTMASVLLALSSVGAYIRKRGKAAA